MNNIDEILQENQSLKIKNQELEHKKLCINNN